MSGMAHYGTVVVTFDDETTKTWENACILLDRDASGFSERSRVVVHDGNHTLASYRSDLVRSAVRLDAEVVSGGSGR